MDASWSCGTKKKKGAEDGAIASGSYLRTKALPKIRMGDTGRRKPAANVRLQPMLRQVISVTAATKL
jgi:hypothetical protein